MKLIIKSIHAGGDFSRERVVLEAVEDTDVGNHVLLATNKGTAPSTVAGGDIPRCYWMPDKKIKKGDLVVVYTKSGTASSKVNPSGTTSYFFYWGKSSAVWSDDKNAVLMDIREWSWVPVVPDEVREEVISPVNAPAPPTNA